MPAYESPGKSNEWHTPKYIFDALDVMFDTDVAAPITGPRHVPCLNFIFEQSLDKEWNGFIWMNPPFSSQACKKKWLDRFVSHRDGIALFPDRTSAPWWQEFAPQMDSILFVAPKIKFERKDGSIGESPGTGTNLFAIGKKGQAALMRANYKIGRVMKIVR